MRRRTLIGGALAASLAAPAIVRAQDTTGQLRDLARRATIYLFPVYEMYRTRWQATVNEANPLRQRLNRFRKSLSASSLPPAAMAPPCHRAATGGVPAPAARPTVIHLAAESRVPRAARCGLRRSTQHLG